MRILLAAIHRPATVVRSVYWALRDMGHDVTTIGPFENAMGWTDNPRNHNCYEWQPHIELVAQDDHTYTPRGGVDPFVQSYDLVLQFDRLVKDAPGCPNVLWALDNHIGPYGYAEEFDHIFIGHSWGHLSDHPKASWLPAAYDPRYHYIIDPKAERDIDVLLLGKPYPHRRKFVADLRERGVNVLAMAGPIWEEYNALYNRAKIALVVSNCGDLSGRVFEHLAAGCMVLCDPIKDMCKAGLRNEQNYFQYFDVDDCAKLVKWLLAEPDLIPEFAAEGHAAGALHTYDARVEELLKVVTA